MRRKGMQEGFGRRKEAKGLTTAYSRIFISFLIPPILPMPVIYIHTYRKVLRFQKKLEICIAE